MNEKEQIKRAQKGDRLAMEQLYLATLDVIYKYVRSRVNTKEDAEDIVSEGYANAFIKISGFRGECSFKTWIYRIVRNELYKFYNTKRNKVTLSDEMQESIPYKESNVQAFQKSDGRLEQVMSQLPVRYADVLNFRFLCCMSIKETAEIMNISESNVKVLQNRALKKAAIIAKNWNL